MLTFDHVTPFGSLGVILESPAIKTLQEFLQKQGKLASGQVTGAMNDATMATIYQLVVDNLDVIKKIDAVPGAVKDGISAVRSVLTIADKAIKGLTRSLVSLKQVLSNFSWAINLARTLDDDTANSLEAKRDEVYNAVGKQAATIEKGLKVGLAVTAFAPPPDTAPATGTTTPTGSGSSSIWSRLKMTRLPATFLPAKAAAGMTATATAAAAAATAAAAAAAAAGAAAAGAAAAGAFAGCIVRYNKTRKKYVIYCRPSGGLGVADANDNCLYGACALGAEAVTPPPPEGMVETAAVDNRPAAGAAQDGGEENVPLYKRPWFWAAVAGAAAAGAGGVVLWRRKRPAATNQFAGYRSGATNQFASYRSGATNQFAGYRSGAVRIRDARRATRYMY